MAEDAAARRPAQHRSTPQFRADQHRSRALRHIEHQGQRGQPLAAGAQHIGRADIARADLPDVAEAGEPGQQQPERDRAEEIAEYGGRSGMLTPDALRRPPPIPSPDSGGALGWGLGG